MRLYFEVARLAFARQLAYRAANLAGLATNSFFGAMRSYLFLGLYAGQATVAGWTSRDALDFVWYGQALIAPVFMWGWWEIALSIRSGDVATDLSKPFDYYAFWLSQDAGRAVFHTLFRGVPTLAVGALLFDVTLPASVARWCFFLLTVALAVWISFGLRFIANVSAFWFLDYRGIGSLLMFANVFFSGLLVPLVYWPDWARPIVGWLPFAGTIQTPIEVVLGKPAGADLARVLLLQLGWAVGLALASRVLMSMAVRKVAIQGG